MNKTNNLLTDDEKYDLWKSTETENRFVLISEVEKKLLEKLNASIVAFGVFEGKNLHDMFFNEIEANELAYLKGKHAYVKPLITFKT